MAKKANREDKGSAAPWQAAGIAMGIGSAAIVAAMLYAKRPQPAPKRRPVIDAED